MTTLTLPLALQGPMMAFGIGTHEREKPTSTTPTKSAVLGLVAAALGRTFTDPQDDLHALMLHVRVDDPGQVQSDFQIVRQALRADGSVNPFLTPVRREYLYGAAFLVLLEGPAYILGSVGEALLNPAFPPYLGRRSCPPARPLYVQAPKTAEPLTVMAEVPDLTGTGGRRLALIEDPSGYYTRPDQPLPERRFANRTLTLTHIQTVSAAP